MNLVEWAILVSISQFFAAIKRQASALVIKRSISVIPLARMRGFSCLCINRSCRTTDWKIVLVLSLSCSPLSISHSTNILRICHRLIREIKNDYKEGKKTYRQILRASFELNWFHALRVGRPQDFCHGEYALELLILIPYRHRARLYKSVNQSCHFLERFTYFRHEKSTENTAFDALIPYSSRMSAPAI